MAKEKFEGARERLFKNVEFHYYKDKAVTFRGKDQWEVSIKTNSAVQAEEWEKAHLNVRHNGTSTKMPTEWSASLNRKVLKRDGTLNDPVRVVDETLKPYTTEERKKIGNESVGNVIVWQGHYDNEHGSGISTSLTAMQIPRDKLQVYEGSMDTVDFENLGEVSSGDGQASKEDLF